MGQWDAETHEAHTERSVSLRKDSISVLGALSEFIVYMRDERRAARLTLDAYERDLLRFAAGLGGGGAVELRAVTAEDVREHMHVLMGRELSNATVRRALYAIASFLGWAQKWELIVVSPAARVTIPPRERTREVRALSKRERSLLVAAADRLARESPRRLDRCAPVMVRLMLKAGLRRSETIDLVWREVHLKRREIVVRHGKGGKTRRVPVDDKELLALLAESAAERNISTAPASSRALSPVLVGTTQRKLTATSFYRVFHRVLELAELGGLGITPHTLRHTFGTVLCDRGVPVPYVKELLGHEDIGSTMVYVHSTPAALRSAVKKLRE